MQIHGPAMNALQDVIFLLALKADEYLSDQMKRA